MMAQIIPIMSRDEDVHSGLASAIRRLAAAHQIMAEQGSAIATAHSALMAVSLYKYALPGRVRVQVESAIALIEGHTS